MVDVAATSYRDVIGQELERYHKNNSALELTISDLRLKLEGIKSEKLRVLQAAGVPDKYTVDLSNKKFTSEAGGARGRGP